MTQVHRNIRGLVLAMAMLSITACGVTVTPSSEPTTPSTAATPECWHSPVTGTCASQDAPVLVVKIDDVYEARPQFNLNAADIVLVEPVEGGLTRLFAVYNSSLPATVGPIRSARITDTDLAPMLGNPLFAYSGSQSKLVPYLKATRMQLVGAPQGGTGYRRLSDRSAPHNYVADTADLLTRVDDPASARIASSEYWAVSKRPTTAGAPVTKVTVRWPSAEKSYIWDSVNARWAMDVYTSRLMTQTDDAGSTERATATNVVIMETDLQDSEFGDKFGARCLPPILRCANRSSPKRTVSG